MEANSDRRELAGGYPGNGIGGTVSAWKTDSVNARLEVKRFRMKRTGRASIVIVVAVALVAAVLVLFLLAGESPSGVASRFLIALAKGDTKTVSELS